MTKIIVDLCSGYGGATQSFLDDDVIKIDIDPNTKPTIIADVKYLPLRPNLKPQLVWASPPCTYFSIARRPLGLDAKGMANSLRLIANCLDAIEHLKPEKWILENPQGYLNKIIGTPTTRIEYETNNEYRHKKTDLWSNDRSLKRAFIPKHVSKTIKDWIVSN